MRQAAVVFFAGASITLASTHTWLTYSPIHMGYAVGLTMLVLAMEIGKVTAAANLTSSTTWGRTSWAIVGTLVCMMASALVELQAVSRVRALLASQTGKVEERTDRAERARIELRSEIDGIAAARSADEVQPLVDTAKKAAGDCGNIKTVTQREACKTLPVLQSELARGRRLSELRSQLVQLDAKTEHIAGASTEAKSLAQLAGLVRVAVPAETVDDWVNIWMVILMQLGAVATAASAPVGHRGHAPREKPVTIGGARGAPDAPQDMPDAPRNMLLAIRGAGGSIEGSQRVLPMRLGVSLDKRTVMRWLTYLASRGYVTVETGTFGTRVTLVEKDRNQAD